MAEIVLQRLPGKVALVTGAGKGIGRSEAMMLAEHGAKVVVCDFGVDHDGKNIAQNVVDEIRALGQEAVAATGDLTLEATSKRAVEMALDAFGGLDILVNNAGLRAGNPVDKMTEGQWDSVLGSHLKASFLLIKHAVPCFRQRGGGSIINTGSEAGLGMVFNSAYAAAKEGLAGLTRSVAREQGRFNIRCNLVRPRSTSATGGGDWAKQNLMGKWRPLLTALGSLWIGSRGLIGWDRHMSPDAIAAFVTWLCTPAASNINGRDFFIGGDELALLSQPEFTHTIMREGGWTLDALDEYAPSLTGDLTNQFLVPNPIVDDD